MADPAALPHHLRDLVRPVSLAEEQTLPVLPALAPLLPGSGLRRGSSVAVQAGITGPGQLVTGTRAHSLALALVAGASAAGSWCAAVGIGDLGLVAAHELGVVLHRFPQVPDPPAGEWAAVVAALLDGVDIVVTAPPASGPSARRGGRVRATDARRLAARARERGAVLVRVGGEWPEGADVVLTVTRAQWEGLGRGHGHLRGRRVEVEVSGRRSAGGGRRQWLWLPHPSGGVEAADPPIELAAVHHISGSISAPSRGGRR